VKKLVVLGAGESGVGTAILGKKEGFDVFVSDKGTIADHYKEVLINFEIEWEENKYRKKEFRWCQKSNLLLHIPKQRLWGLLEVMEKPQQPCLQIIYLRMEVCQ